MGCVTGVTPSILEAVEKQVCITIWISYCIIVLENQYVAKNKPAAWSWIIETIKLESDRKWNDICQQSN